MAAATPIMETADMTIKEKQPLKLRHELKYNINQQDDRVLTSRLRKLFSHDTYAGSHGSYRVSSIYFDTPYDKALRQKLDGTNNREKFRLRYYGEDTSFIRLEKKFKINGMCGKHSVSLPPGQVRKILTGDIDFLLCQSHPLLIELYSKMRGQLMAPKTIVVYDREAFVYEPGNVRITLDRNLSTGMNNLDFFNTKQSRTAVSEGMAVLEIKYDAYLPEIVRMAVQIPCRQITAYSKYAVCRRYD